MITINFYKDIFKPTLDFALAIFGVIITLPITIIIISILFLTTKGKPIFFQNRVGKGGKVFKLMKFKTLKDVGEYGEGSAGDFERMTTIGKFLRNTSLDEIPQLLNIISGTMSLVGPRPLLVEYLPYYSVTQHRRHLVKPGITGWAQVNGRNAISWKRKFELDVWYVDNIKFCLDLKIMFMTLKKVIAFEGVNAESGTTMEMFKGNN